MIEYISQPDQFAIEKEYLRRVFNDQVDLPNNLFTNDFKYFDAFEFDLVYSDVFFDGFKKIKNHWFTFYTISPSPEEYFFKHFGKFSVGKFNLDCHYDDYINFLNSDPGNSPADALICNSELVTFYSNEPNWGIVGSKDAEIAIVGFKKKVIRNVFLNAFNCNVKFGSIEWRMYVLDQMLHLKDNSKKFYLSLIDNYQ